MEIKDVKWEQRREKINTSNTDKDLILEFLECLYKIKVPVSTALEYQESYVYELIKKYQSRFEKADE